MQLHPGKDNPGKDNKMGEDNDNLDELRPPLPWLTSICMRADNGCAATVVLSPNKTGRARDVLAMPDLDLHEGRCGSMIKPVTRLDWASLWHPCGACLRLCMACSTARHDQEACLSHASCLC